jgi:hypothetical protein
MRLSALDSRIGLGRRGAVESASLAGLALGA